MNIHRQKIQQLSEELIGLPLSRSPKDNLENMRMLFSGAINRAGIKVQKHELATRTPFGKALPANDAASCMNDSERTRVFVKGFYEAILEAKRRFPGERIKVLYAGCGPFATLATIVAPLFKDGELEVTALDIHEISVQCAQKVVECLGLQANIPNIKKADAIDYQHVGEPFHIVITETMYRMLLQEPQAAITANIARYCHPNGIFIPESVLVQAWLGKEGDDGSICLGDIVDLRQNFGRATTLSGKLNHQHLGRLLKVDKRFPLPKLDADEPLMCTTRIQVFGENALRPDVGIVNRDARMPICHQWTPGDVRIRYVMGKDNYAAVQVNHEINGTVKDILL